MGRSASPALCGAGGRPTTLFRLCAACGSDWPPMHVKAQGGWGCGKRAASFLHCLPHRAAASKRPLLASVSNTRAAKRRGLRRRRRLTSFAILACPAGLVAGGGTCCKNPTGMLLPHCRPVQPSHDLPRVQGRLPVPGRRLRVRTGLQLLQEGRHRDLPQVCRQVSWHSSSLA